MLMHGYVHSPAAQSHHVFICRRFNSPHLLNLDIEVVDPLEATLVVLLSILEEGIDKAFFLRIIIEAIGKLALGQLDVFVEGGQFFISWIGLQLLFDSATIVRQPATHHIQALAHRA